MPARPFLMPVAAAMGEEVARAMGAAVAAALKGDSPEADGTSVDLGGNDPPTRSDACAPALASNTNATSAGNSLPAVTGVSSDGSALSRFGTPVADGRTRYDNLAILAKTPNSGEPNIWHVNPGSGQMRLFDPSGRPALDLDHDHPHDGIQPHVHIWLDGVRGPGIAIPDGF